MKRKVTNTIFISIFALFMLVVLCFLGLQPTVMAFAKEETNEKVLCTATLDDEFDDSSFCVTTAIIY